MTAEELKKIGDSRSLSTWVLYQTGIYIAQGGTILNPEDYQNTNNSTIEGKNTTFDDFIFIGDSYTVGLQESTKNDEVFKNATFLAEKNEDASYWIQNYSQIESTYNSAKGVCVLLGVNNATDITSMKNLIQKLATGYSATTPIYIQKVFPVGENYTSEYIEKDKLNSNIETYNKEIKKYIEEQNWDNVYYIDTTTGCVDSATGYLSKTSDNLHLNSAGMTTWKENLRNTILK